ECLPACEVTCTQPCAYSRNLEPCVASCGDSRAIVYPPPVVLTFPGPTLSSCSQESIVGTSIPQPYGALTSSSSDESYGMGASVVSGGVGGMGGSFGYGGSSG
ncbi:KRFA protein, partial [Chionis minor]|nr:KRFA protein [Chionis minor]NXT49851.1 KRFA protein [Pluvianellus socialis]